MGTFAGHALPGSFFLIFSLWWTIQVFCRFFESLAKNGRPFQSSATFLFPCSCSPITKYIELEGWLKMLFTIIGILGEVITGWTGHGSLVIPGNLQHVTMFFFFGLTGFIDILYHYNVPLPRNLDYIFMGFALAVEGFLFSNHLRGRSSMDVQVHVFLLCVIVANFVAGAFELVYRSSVICALFRAYFVMVQGVWFWTIGFILYNPLPSAVNWDQENHEQMALVTVLFVWMMGGVAFTMAVVGCVTGCIRRRKIQTDCAVTHAQEDEEDFDDESWVSEILDQKQNDYKAYLRLLNDDISK